VVFGGELRINSALLKALEVLPDEGAVPPPAVTLAAILHRLALETGLVERDDPDFVWVENAGLPSEAIGFLMHYVGDGRVPFSDELVRQALYAALVDVSNDGYALRIIDRRRSISSAEMLTFAQIYWNLEADGDRSQLPIRSGQRLESGLLARIKVVGSQRNDYATMDLKSRAAFTPGYTSSGGAFYARGARIAVLVALRLAARKDAPSAGDVAKYRALETGRGVEWLIEWPVGPPRDWVPDPANPVVAAASAAPVLAGAAIQEETDARLARIEAALGALENLRVVTHRAGKPNPSHFLSGASMDQIDADRYAIARTVDVAGEVLDVEAVADRICQEDPVLYLVAGAGEGKTTYLHSLATALERRAIIFSWRPRSGELGWSWLQRFRDEIRREGGDPLPIVVLGELQSRPTRDEEEAIVEILQSIPAGLAPAQTSIVLAGRPEWVNRIRLRASIGQMMRLMPPTADEAELLVDNIAKAYEEMVENRGRTAVDSAFPNVRRFLALPKDTRAGAFMQENSLVGPLLRAAYGHSFVNRLAAEYSDMDSADQSAYLAVCLATSAVGGISEDLLDLLCPDADLDQRSSGSPWLRGLDGLHRARHSMIGRVVVEDGEASSLRDISVMTTRIVSASAVSQEARDLFIGMIRDFDGSMSMVPAQRRKSSPQFYRAVRIGLLDDAVEWWRVEAAVRSDPKEIVALSYALHCLVPSPLVFSDLNDELLLRNGRLLESAEAASVPGSSWAQRARFHRVFVERQARVMRGEQLNDIEDVRILLPMMDESWPESLFFAQFLTLGLQALKSADLDEDEQDRVAEAVLAAWQRLRVDGSTDRVVYPYSEFVARELTEWSALRRFGLWYGAWEYSKAIGIPDGFLACLIDAELIRAKDPVEPDPVARRTLRLRVLGDSVVLGQDDAEVVLRYADLAGIDDHVAQDRVARVARHLARDPNPITRSMALHALGLSANDLDERLAALRAAVAAYEESIGNRDDWLTRSAFWKRALRQLRSIDPGGAEIAEPALAAAGKKFGR